MVGWITFLCLSYDMSTTTYLEVFSSPIWFVYGSYTDTYGRGLFDGGRYWHATLRYSNDPEWTDGNILAVMTKR